MTGHFEIAPSDALLIIDVQNDFCPGGALAVPGGDDVVPLINGLAAKFAHAIVTQDWHPAGHASFASAHPGAKPYEVMAFPYGQQILWPDHCVQGSHGAALHSGLDVPRAELILRKGYHPGIDSYSAFFENDRVTPTGLAGYLRERGLTRIFIAGLAFDFCVSFTAQDAARCGFATVVMQDACRAIDMHGSAAAARALMQAAGVSMTTSSQFGH